MRAISRVVSCRHLVVDEGDVAPGELPHQLGEELGELVVVSAEAGEGPVLHRCTVLYCTVLYCTVLYS